MSKTRKFVESLLSIVAVFAAVIIATQLGLFGQSTPTSSSTSSEPVCDTKYGVQECSTEGAAQEKAEERANEVGGTACVKRGHDDWYQWYVSKTVCRGEQ